MNLESKYPITQVDFFVGDEENYLGSIKKYPFEFNIDAQENIKIKIYDSVGNQTKENVVLNLNI